MLRKSPASNTWAAILKNTDFSLGSLKVTKFSKFKLFSYLKFFFVSFIKKLTFTASVKLI